MSSFLKQTSPLIIMGIGLIAFIIIAFIWSLEETEKVYSMNCDQLWDKISEQFENKQTPKTDNVLRAWIAKECWS